MRVACCSLVCAVLCWSSPGVAQSTTALTGDPPEAPTGVAEWQNDDIEQPRDESNPPEANDPRYGLLTPIPSQGGLPPIYSRLTELSAEEQRVRARVREYERQIREIRKKHLGQIKLQRLRDEGMKLLAEFTDPAAFLPLAQELARENDAVRLWLLDHFAAHGEFGQAALAWVVIYDQDTAIRNEALRRLKSPAAPPLLRVVDCALRQRDAEVVNAAAIIVNTLDIIQAIPLLIFAQATGAPPVPPEGGDLAWIAIQTQHAYVAGLVPVVGAGAGAFQPIIGVVSEGSVLRVVDAVVIEYRTVTHYSLVNLTTRDWGHSTANMSYNIQQWWSWYNDVYLPFKLAQRDKNANRPEEGENGSS